MAREYLSEAAHPAPKPVWKEYPDSGKLAAALAARVSSVLAEAVSERGHALLAVSGGRTPQAFFDALSRQDPDWDKVTVTLVDERFVPPESLRSNARLVIVRLLQNGAARARFEGLFVPAGDVRTAARETNARLAALALPFDAVILGMGADGHTASFFPDAVELTSLLDPEGPAEVAAVHSESAGEPRLTWTLPAIAGARTVFLHIEGLAKKDVLLSALAANSGRLPIRIVIDEARAPVEIHWAPDGKA